MDRHDAPQSLWQPWLLTQETLYTPRVGPLQLWVEHREDELYIASRRLAAGASLPEAEGDTAIDTREWQRWVCGADPLHAVLEPRLPDRPVIVRPAMPVTVLPGQEVEFFVSIPVGVAVRGFRDAGARMDMCEEPSVRLSSSWFGLPVEGVLCYALKTRARRRMEDLRTDVNLAICPVTIRNNDTASLTFERLCLRVQSLGIYAGEHHLWTNRGSLLHRGQETMTTITFDSAPPSCDAATRMLSAPRDPHRKTFMMRAFDSVKSMSGL